MRTQIRTRARAILAVSLVAMLLGLVACSEQTPSPLGPDLSKGEHPVGFNFPRPNDNPAPHGEVEEDPEAIAHVESLLDELELYVETGELDQAYKTAEVLFFQLERYGWAEKIPWKKIWKLLKKIAAIIAIIPTDATVIVSTERACDANFECTAPQDMIGCVSWILRADTYVSRNCITIPLPF